MSSVAARTRPASRPERLRETRPDLRVVEGTHSRRLVVPLVVAVLLALTLAIVVPLVVNTAMAQRSLEIRDLQLQLNGLDAEAWTLQTQLQEKSSPTSLESAAQALGMVPAGSLGVIDLSTGGVQGGQAAQ